MAFGDSLTYVDGWDNIVDVLDIALHNSRFGNLRLSVSSNDVIPLPNKSALEVEVLDLCMNGVASADLIIDVIASFRKIQVLNLFCYENFTDFTPVIDLCRENGVRRFVDLSSGMDLM
ncbi:hypothetical protein AAVH_31128 [Aphelenchoides avenae]|nr:hypothetical protein AAVH_31128 [Aphelenchus avenae]